MPAPRRAASGHRYRREGTAGLHGRPFGRPQLLSPPTAIASRRSTRRVCSADARSRTPPDPASTVYAALEERDAPTGRLDQEPANRSERRASGGDLIGIGVKEGPDGSPGGCASRSLALRRQVGRRRDRTGWERVRSTWKSPEVAGDRGADQMGAGSADDGDRHLDGDRRDGVAGRRWNRRRCGLAVHDHRHPRWGGDHLEGARRRGEARTPSTMDMLTHAPTVSSSGAVE